MSPFWPPDDSYDVDYDDAYDIKYDGASGYEYDAQGQEKCRIQLLAGEEKVSDTIFATVFLIKRLPLHLCPQDLQRLDEGRKGVGYHY